MKRFEGEIPVFERGIKAVAGRFEGMHLGHIAALKALAASGGDSLMLSLYDQNAQALTTEDEKAEIAEKCGISAMVSAPYAREDTARAEPLPYNGKYAPCERAEIPALLRRMNAEPAAPISPVTRGGLVISTCMLESAFESRDFEEYAALCGRPYRLCGTVGHGRSLGRTVDMPTANLTLAPNKRLPPQGVYATVARFEGTRRTGVTNIGVRPSVDSDERVTVETYLTGFSGSIYGAYMELDIRFFIRGIRRFDDLAQVKAQVEADAALAIARLGA